MPSGRTHDIITATTTPVVGYVTYLITADIKTTTILTFAYVFASLMFNGDLDIESRPYYRWSIMRFIWLPYQKIFHHRSVFTHGLIIGTIIRILYLIPIPILILGLSGDLNMILNLNPQLILLVLIGLELGSAIHTISDYTI